MIDQTVLFTTDISDLKLTRFDLVVLPVNRCRTKKVEEVEIYCDKISIPLTWQIRHNDARLLEEDGLDPYPTIYGDFGISWFYTMLFDEEILSRMPLLNFHAGEPGPHALKKAFDRQDTTIRCFWHRVDSGIDNGPIIVETTISLPDIFHEARDLIITTGICLFREITNGINK